MLVLEQRHFDHAAEGLRRFVDGVQVQAVQPLVGQRDLLIGPGAPQIIVGSLRPPEAIDDAPTRRGPEVLEKPHQPAPVFRVSAAPLRERLRHDFARDHAAFTARGVRFIEDPRHEVYGTVAVFHAVDVAREDSVRARACVARIRLAVPGASVRDRRCTRFDTARS